MKKFHLQNELGLYKDTLKKCHSEHSWAWEQGTEDHEQWKKDKELLEQRTQMYTAEEIQSFLGYYWTGHDQCVIDNQDEYAFEVPRVEAKEQKIQEVEDYLKENAELKEPKFRVEKMAPADYGFFWYCVYVDGVKQHINGTTLAYSAKDEEHALSLFKQDQFHAIMNTIEFEFHGWGYEATAEEAHKRYEKKFGVEFDV